MARYRHKDETDVAWNKVRRIITREVDTAIMNAREEVLNTILATAWEDFSKKNNKDGVIPEVSTKYTKLANEIVSDVVARIPVS